MIKTEDRTREKILLSALALFSERGISKTSLHEVAYRAGVTRVTVYRHFAEKKELVREAFLRVEQVFEKGLADLKRNPREDGEKILNQISRSGRAISKNKKSNGEEIRGPCEGELWELVMGGQVHIGGLRSSMDLAERAGIGPGMSGVDLCCCNGAGMRFLVRFRNVAKIKGRVK